MGTSCEETFNENNIDSSCGEKGNVNENGMDTSCDDSFNENMNISTEDRNTSDFCFLDVEWYFQNVNLAITRATVTGVSKILWRKTSHQEDPCFQNEASFTVSSFSEENNHSENSVSAAGQEFHNSNVNSPSVFDCNDCVTKVDLEILHSASALSEETGHHSLQSKSANDLFSDCHRRFEAKREGGDISRTNECFEEVSSISDKFLIVGSADKKLPATKSSETSHLLSQEKLESIQTSSEIKNGNSLKGLHSLTSTMNIGSQISTSRKRKMSDVLDFQQKKPLFCNREIQSQSISEIESITKTSSDFLGLLTTSELRTILQTCLEHKCDSSPFPDECDKNCLNSVHVASTEKTDLSLNNDVALAVDKVEAVPANKESDVSSQSNSKIISFGKQLIGGNTSYNDLQEANQLEDSASSSKVSVHKNQNSPEAEERFVGDTNTTSVKKCGLDKIPHANDSHASKEQVARCEGISNGEKFSTTKKFDLRNKTKRNHRKERFAENHEFSHSSDNFVSSGNEENVHKSSPRDKLFADGFANPQAEPFVLACKLSPLFGEPVNSCNNGYTLVNSSTDQNGKSSIFERKNTFQLLYSNDSNNSLLKKSSEDLKQVLSPNSSITCSKELHTSNTELCKVPESPLQDRHLRRFQEINLVPKSIRSSVGNRIYETNEVYLIIIGWNSDWLMEQERCADPPPISQTVLPIKDLYSSFQEYYNTYFPLLLLETWQNIYTTWVSKSKEFVCKLVDYTEKTEWINAECETFIEKCSDRNIDEASIVLIRFKTIEKTEIKMLGYVHSSSKRHYSAVHDKDHSALAYIKSPPNGLKKLKLKLFIAFKSNAINKSEMVTIQKLANIKKTLVENDALLRIADCKLSQIILNPSRAMCVSLPSPSKTMAFSNCVQKVSQHILKSNSHLIVVKTLLLSDRIVGATNIVSEIRKHRHSKVIILFKTDSALLDFAFNLAGKKFVILEKTLNSTVPTTLLKHTLESLTFENVPRNRSMSAKKQQVLIDRNIVLARLANSYFEHIYSLLSNLTFTCCILDDASLFTEVESIMPLLHGVEKFILIGNPATRPYVQSKSALNFRYNTSLYHRTFNLSKETTV